MQLRNTSALALRGVSSLSASSSCARRSILSSSSSLSSRYSTSSVSRAIARPAATTLRPALAPSSAQSNSSVFSTHIRTMASQASKIKVKNPVVELDGDEVRYFLPVDFCNSDVFFMKSKDSIGRGAEVFSAPQLIVTNQCVSRCCPCPTLMHHMQAIT